MSKAFDIINIHTLIRELLQTYIPGTIIKFIANYIKGRKAYTPYINHTSKQHQFKLTVLKAASFQPHHLTFTPQTYHHPVHRFMSWPTHMTSPSHPQAQVQPRNIYNHTYRKFCLDKTKQSHTESRQNNLHSTLFTPDSAYMINLDLNIHNNALPMATHPTVLGLTFNPKLTYSTHIHNISVHARKPLQIIKSLTATGWGRQKERLMGTYKAVMRPALE